MNNSEQETSYEMSTKQETSYEMSTKQESSGTFA